MKVFDFPIIRLTLCLIIGIALRYFYDVSLKISLLLSGSLLILLLINYLILLKSFKKKIWFGLLTYITMISIGISVKNLHNEQNFDKHYTNHIEINQSDLHRIQLDIVETLKPNKTFNRYVVKVSKIDANNVVGRLLLNVKRDSTSTLFHVDNKILVYSSLQELYAPLNPYQFNYKKYLNDQDIYAQIYCDSSSLFIESTKTSSIIGYADVIRRIITSKLENFNFHPNEFAIIKALFLGQRQDISNELRQQYVSAGAIHILAISGLHIGIILIILNWLFGFFTRFKHGYVIKTIIILILLWAFAIIAGLSPSVLRAVTMFSAVAIAMNLKRPHNIYNTLAISAFVLLLFKPMFLFEVGFQLSYLAVIGIVSIQPILYNAIKTKFWLINKVLILLTVSVAAQIGVLPLSLYYFHQFPGLFFLSNIVVIPFLGFILGCGFIVIIMSLLNIPYNFIVLIFEKSITWMNYFFNWVSLQESFIFRNVSFSLILVICTYIVIVCAYRLLVKINAKHIVLVSSSIILFQSIYLYNNYRNTNHNEFVIFHKSRNSLLVEKTGENLKWYHNLDSTEMQTDYIINNYSVGNFIKTSTTESLKNIYSFNNKTLLVMDSLGVYQNLSFKPDYVLITQSPKINLNRLVDSLNAKTIIADDSNYKSYITRWKKTCNKRKIPFHYTGEKGAFIWK